MLEFETELSCNLYHDGALGQYRIVDCTDYVILELVTSDAAGPITEPLGDFKSVSDAIAEATRLESENDNADDRGNEI